MLGSVFGSLVVVRGWVVSPVTAWVSSGCGFWRGCGLWVVDWCGCGLWVVDQRGWVVVVDRRGWVVVVDRRAGMKRVVGRGSASWDEVGRWSWIGG